jgi:hypothetical protein
LPADLRGTASGIAEEVAAFSQTALPERSQLGRDARRLDAVEDLTLHGAGRDIELEPAEAFGVRAG